MQRTITDDDAPRVPQPVDRVRHRLRRLGIIRAHSALATVESL
jgi:hypothetical protein